MNGKTRKILEKMYQMKVADFTDPRAWDMPLLQEDEPITHAFFMLRSNNHAWVVNDEKEMLLRGTVERTDLLRAMLPPDAMAYSYGAIKLHKKNLFQRDNVSVRDVMTSKLITAKGDMTIKEVMIRMKKYDLERLPVVDKKGVLRGEITLKSIIIYFTRMVREEW
jgi:CBS domain-containing protein